MKISQTNIKLILTVLALGLFASGISLVFYNNINFCGGVAFGALFTCFKLILTEKSIEHSLRYDSKGADGYMKAQYAVRYFITGGALIAAALIPQINLYGAIIGIVLAQPAAYIVMFMEGRTGETTQFQNENTEEN